MKNKYWINIKTGNRYELIQDDIFIKDYDDERSQNPLDFVWRGEKHNGEHFILYKALYDCPDGPFFVRHESDFLENFKQVKE